MRLLKLFLAALALLPLLSRADLLETNDPNAAAIRPADGTAVQHTPPDFSWPDISKRARYTVNLTYPDGKTRSLAAPQNYLNWNEALAPGAYSWTVTATDAGGARTSERRRFTVDKNAQPFVVPDMDKLAAELKAKPHPRGLPEPAALEKMARQREGAVRELRAEIERRMREPLPRAPESESPSNDESVVIDEIKRTQAALIAYVLTKDDRAFNEAQRRVKNLASWDPNGSTAYTRPYLNLAARVLTFTMVLGYDWLHPRLDAPAKQLLLSSISARLNQINADVIGERSRVAREPRDSHGQGTATMLGMMATLMVGDLPEAEGWMKKALPLAINLVTPWGGEDGGFANGSAYGLWYTGQFLPLWYVMRWATGIDFAQKAWVRNHAGFLAYFNPPGTPARLFGDGHEQAMLKEQSARFGKGYSYFAPSPLMRWYASRLSGEGATRMEYLLAPPADFSGSPPLPKGTPNALLLPSTGWVAMHSSLEDDDRVSVYFKSSPPPYGAFNHQHADQNGFVINAGGERLAIESGYYDGWKTKHWWNWLHQTRAKNAITYDGGKGQIFFEETDYKKMRYGRITKFSSSPQYDITTGDATQAYDGALKRALRSLVYLRPNLLVVHDKLASDTARRWEWNIHALKKISVLSDKKIRIENAGQSLCVEMLAAPPLKFSQTDAWIAPEPVKGDGKTISGAEPSKGAAQWHGRFSSAPLAATDFIALLDVGCNGTQATATRDDSGAWTVQVGGKIVKIAADEDISVQ
jgi:hypothetical protein